MAFRVEGHALWTSQATEKSRHVALRSDLVDAIEARGGRPGHEQVSMGTESQMVSRDTGFESCENKNLTVGTDLENCAAAVADIKIFRAIEGNAGSNTHSLGVGGHGSVRSDPIHCPVKARRNVHLTTTVKSD